MVDVHCTSAQGYIKAIPEERSGAAHARVHDRAIGVNTEHGVVARGATARRIVARERALK